MVYLISQSIATLTVNSVSVMFTEIFHSAAFSFGPVILERDREAFEAHCYMTSARRDIVTENLETAADQWRPCWGKPDSQIADTIRHDKIHILVDLTGHSAGNKLLAFARRRAPIQVFALGHCTGTGKRAMDYLLADATTIPRTDAFHCTEEVELSRATLCVDGRCTRRIAAASENERIYYVRLPQPYRKA